MLAPHIAPSCPAQGHRDPSQDIYLAAAMLGPMFGFTEDDLVRLRARSRQVQAEPDKKPARISLYGALLLALEDPADDPLPRR